MNETSRIAKLQELATLNGGIAIEFTDTVYALPDKDVLSFDELRTEAMQSDPQLQTCLLYTSIRRRRRALRSLTAIR